MKKKLFYKAKYIIRNRKLFFIQIKLPISIMRYEIKAKLFLNF